MQRRLCHENEAALSAAHPWLATATAAAAREEGKEKKKGKQLHGHVCVYGVFGPS
jgi:hypothetical protein